jgi:hypothetical protein
MGGACSTNGGEQERVLATGGNELKEDQDAGHWIILKWILEIEWGGIDWISMAQDRDKCRALENVVMNFWV